MMTKLEILAALAGALPLSHDLGRALKPFQEANSADSAGRVRYAVACLMMAVGAAALERCPDEILAHVAATLTGAKLPEPGALTPEAVRLSVAHSVSLANEVGELLSPLRKRSGSAGTEGVRFCVACLIQAVAAFQARGRQPGFLPAVRVGAFRPLDGSGWRWGEELMPHATILVNEDRAKEWFGENHVDVHADTNPDGSKCALCALVLVRDGMASGQPSVMLAVEVDGKMRVVETSLQLLETACSGMRAASGVPRAP